MRPETSALLEKAGKSIQASYYAMFYIAEALLLEEDLSYSSHSAVISAYGKEFARTGRMDSRFHRYLLDAQDTRNIGDYGIGQGVSEEQVQDSLQWAEEFLQAAQQFLRK
jgi:uncharacterized protein (UPF0332 family)